ncbi:MAG: D-alanyl-D-alanine dipeptidase [Alphaproteobacteria bacterium]|nr:D-alanyl-D-alanine dipeptidase [Alphaproteobacteria bacterium]NCQ67207.1 D-alanyl-D-alanine dipeptidase [Alphaproteobacteria bacterium]NCT07051.1 D-alanyl-D-alanine dipeptidase [Alphaproteobacteria bacterium]
MTLIQLHPIQNKLILDLAYATSQNFTGNPVYARSLCYLHKDAHEKLLKALEIANAQGYALKIFDAFRPQEAQEKLWAFCSDPTYICPPEKGSPHSRGVAVDLTLVDQETGQDLDMGTPFDDFTVFSHHGNTDINQEAQRNRCLLTGIMTLAGWDFFKTEWWHYQLFQAREKYDLLYDKDLEIGMMD